MQKKRREEKQLIIIGERSVIKFDEEAVKAHIEKNMNKVSRGIRITKDCNDKISWLIYEHYKRNDRINISGVVERAIDLYCEAMAHSKE